MILVTGATGFIGSRLLQTLQHAGEACRAMQRQGEIRAGVVLADLEDNDSLRRACEGVDTIFHCAGYAHAFRSSEAEECMHWRVNFRGTENLLAAACAAGVRRFVYLSSVKAVGEPGAECVDEEYPAPPLSAYGLAKRAAEARVLAAGANGVMHVVVLRPAMVYGRGGRGNLERMARLVAKGWFPPLPETGNRRSLVHVTDLVDAMRLVASNPLANGRIYIVASSEMPSGRALYDALRQALSKSPVSWALPRSLLNAAARAGDFLGGLLGRRVPFNTEVLSRLLDDACYSAARLKKELGWTAKVTLAEGLREMLGHDQTNF